MLVCADLHYKGLYVTVPECSMLQEMVVHAATLQMSVSVFAEVLCTPAEGAAAAAGRSWLEWCSTHLASSTLYSQCA